MRAIRFALAAAGLLMTTAGTHAQDPGYAAFRLGQVADATPVTSGGLLLAGGGTDQPAAFRWMIERAGGGDVVVIRASGTDAYNPFILKQGDVNSVETIVFRRREAASDPAVIARLDHAEAIFLAGGDQSNYVRYWKDTPVEEALHRAVQRNAVVGGTSAGLAVLSEFSFSAMHDTVRSDAALADPYSPNVTIEGEFLKLPWLAGVITDSHFVERDRLGRTLTFLARMVQDGLVRPARAIAIDRETALLVAPSGDASIVGRNTAYFLRTTAAPEVCRPETPLTLRNVDTYRLTADDGGTFNLRTWTGAGGLAYRLSVVDGKIVSSKGAPY